MECRKKSNQKCKKKTYLNIIKEKFKKCKYSKNQNQIKSETNGQRRPPKKRQSNWYVMGVRRPPYFPFKKFELFSCFDIFSFPGLYFLEAMITPFILRQSHRDDQCMHIFRRPTLFFKSSISSSHLYHLHFLYPNLHKKDHQRWNSTALYPILGCYDY